MQQRRRGLRVPRVDLPGAAHLLLADNVVHLDEAKAVFDTIDARLGLVQRFHEFTGTPP